MFNHIMVGSSDIARSKRFYDAVLGVIGAPAGTPNTNASGQNRVSYRHDGNAFTVTEPLNGQPPTFANGGTIGFKCATPEQVLQFHAAALAQGGTAIEDPPGPRGTGAVHLAYVRDPDGNKLCVVYRAPQ